MVTIKEVAKLAEVSPSTVSRVISNSPRISEETKVRVREAMKELGYYPNAIARSLVRKTTNTIAIVMPYSAERAILNPFFPLALSGITAAAHREKYCLLLSTGNSEQEQQKSIEEIVSSGRVDGVIIMYSSVDNITLETVKKFNVPVVIIGKPLSAEGVLYVDNDNVKATYNLAMQLIKNGHKKIALLSGPFSMVVSLDRLDGYRDALIDSGLNFDRKYIMESDFTQEAGYKDFMKLMELKEKPTAIIVTDDVLALGAIKAAKEKKISIPKDIEIVSFNNVPLSEVSQPSLTSVDIDAYSLGFEASKLIIEKVKGKAKINKVIVPTRIISRESTTSF